MKKRILGMLTFLLFISAGILSLVQCDHSGMARVTIHIQNDTFAQKNETLIDRILNLVSTKAYATDNAWTNHASGNILLSISASDMEKIETTIAPTQSSFTTEVPAGAQRTIRLVYDNEGSYDPQKPHGAQKTVDLTPGDNDVSIYLLPMTAIFGEEVGAGIYIIWYPVSLLGDYTINYNIYRSLSPTGPYNKMNPAPLVSSDYNDSSGLVPGTTYYYRVSVLTDGVEGLLSDSYPVSY